MAMMVCGRRYWVVPALTLALTSCVSVDHGKQAGGSSGSSAGSGSSSGGSSSGSHRGAGGASGGGKSGTGGRSVGGASGSGGFVGDAGPPPTNTVPALDAISAHVTGRGGDDLMLTAAGTDAEGDVLFMAVRLMDDKGDPVLVFAPHWDGVVDSAENRLLFDASLAGRPRFVGTVTLPGFATRWPDATRAVVHLEDAAGNASDDQTVDVVQQGVKRGGEPCDPEIISDRCESGLSCSGDPASCQEGRAPSITNVVYVRSPEGPPLLISGEDPDDAIAPLRLHFLTRPGAPVRVDLDGDQIADSSTWDLDAHGHSSHGSFFVKDQLGLGFEATVPKIKVTPIDGQ